MIECNTEGLSKEVGQVVELISGRFAFACVRGSGLRLSYEVIGWDQGSQDMPGYVREGDSLIIRAFDLPGFLRILTQYVAADGVEVIAAGGSGALGATQTARVENFRPQVFQKMGLMLDTSRNAVPNVAYAKWLIETLACMGMNTFYLYMEDTYKLDFEPYFGYLRGAYTQEELKELDAHAGMFGVELIPCIQTLAHLNQLFLWDDMDEKYRDIDDVLFVGKPEVFELQDQMIRYLSETFTSRRIHLGLDEAVRLGRGRYADFNGLRNAKEIMMDHLLMMQKLCEKYGMKAMVWDDMFFRNYTTSAANDMRVTIPDDVELVYWNYYDNDKQSYLDAIRDRKSSASQVVFAGGAWKWQGYTPHHSKSIITLEASLAACKEEQIQEYMVTSWGDDGSESPVLNALFGCLIVAAYGSGDEDYQKDCKMYLGMDYEDFRSVEDLDLVKGKGEVLTPSKYLLYEDPLLSKFVYHSALLDKGFTDLYVGLAEHYRSLSAKYADNAYVRAYFDFYAAYADVLSHKADIAYDLYKAYRDGDRERIAEQVGAMQTAVQLLPQMLAARKALWYRENKAYGMEVLEHRLGGLMTRLLSIKEDLRAFLEDGDGSALAALEEERLPIREEFRDKGLICYNRTLRTMTAQAMIW